MDILESAMIKGLGTFGYNFSNESSCPEQTFRDNVIGYFAR